MIIRVVLRIGDDEIAWTPEVEIAGQVSKAGQCVVDRVL